MSESETSDCRSFMSVDLTGNNQQTLVVLTDFTKASFAIVSNHYVNTFKRMGLQVEHLPYPSGDGDLISLSEKYQGALFFHNTNGKNFRPVKGETNIAWVLHEWSRYPSQWLPYLEPFSEVWTTTLHVSELLEESGLKTPALFLPPALDSETVPAKSSHCVSNPFRFLYVGEWHFRKGLHLLFHAWEIAFPQPGTASLTVKTSASCPFESPREDIQIIRESIAEPALHQLYLDCDCYISTSLGEGLGLPIAEAIMARLPVAANLWGGHKSLLISEGCFEIPHSEIIQPYCSLPELYAIDQKCAFSDPREIAKILRRIVETDAKERRMRAEHAYQWFRLQYGYEVVRERLLQRLKELRSNAN